MAEFFHAGRTNTDDCYDAGKHVHGSRRVYGHTDQYYDDVARRRPAHADDSNSGEVGAVVAGGASFALKEHKEVKESRAQDGHFCH